MTVVAELTGPARELRVRRCAGATGFTAVADRDGVHLTHSLDETTVSDHRVVAGLCALVSSGALAGQEEFETAFTRVVEDCGPDPAAGWRAFYRNSVRELRSGHSSFSPVHRRARSLLVGDSVLEVGSCFGFLALQCAQDGYQVTACDICPGALDLLDAAAADLGAAVTTVAGDARALPQPDDAVDTVTLIHLLEHLDGPDVQAAIGEALRVARRRVVIAVPYESEPSGHFGHRQRLSAADLSHWASRWPGCTAEIFADHGGWLVLDHPGPC
ncbi:mycofactocin oligosaccharide methyltransferase MftM [Gordonia caeni]|uniref:Mycofactocin oligosaccharide methyltransferase MftM n=1 Tax=Gordonia caeni TaxID=1007097 RepID=A0ABP7PAB2_9ACTN